MTDEHEESLSCSSN